MHFNQHCDTFSNDITGRVSTAFWCLEVQIAVRMRFYFSGVKAIVSAVLPTCMEFTATKRANK